MEHLWVLGKHKINGARLSLTEMIRRFLMDRFTHSLSVEQQLLKSKESLLKAVEPDSIVQRGFALLRSEDGKIVNTVKKIKTGAVIHATVRDGKISSTVNSVTGEK